MPRVRLLLKTSGKGWTKTPNLLIDRLLPILRDTELRVLFVILRTTTGWNREGLPVSLTYRSLVSRTGRQSEAVSRALRRLERLGAIHILDADLQEPLRIAKNGSPESEAYIKTRK
jgi:hypothetical protein